MFIRYTLSAPFSSLLAENVGSIFMYTSCKDIVSLQRLTIVSITHAWTTDPACTLLMATNATVSQALKGTIVKMGDNELTNINFFRKRTTTTKQYWKQRQKQQQLNYSMPEWPSLCLTGMGDYKSANEQARNLQGVWSWCSFLPFSSRPYLADLDFFKFISFCFPSSLKAIYALATYSDIHWGNLWQKKKIIIK